MGTGFDMGPLIFTDEVTLVYMSLIRCCRCALKPQALIMENRYSWDMLSKAVVKSKDTKHNGALEYFAWAIASLAVAIASKTL